MPRPADVPPPSTGFLLGHVALRWRVAMDRTLGPLGLTSAQYALLASLYALTRHGARPSQRELGEFAGVEPMSVSKVVRGLERAGLVTRTANPADPRAVELAVTPLGEERITTAAAVVRDLHDRLLTPLGGLGGERRARFDEDLQALLRHLTELAGERPGARADAPTGPTARTSRLAAHGGSAE